MHINSLVGKKSFKFQNFAVNDTLSKCNTAQEVVCVRRCCVSSILQSCQNGQDTERFVVHVILGELLATLSLNECVCIYVRKPQADRKGDNLKTRLQNNNQFYL